MLVVISIILLIFVLPPPIGIAVLSLALIAEVAELIFWRRFLQRYKIQSGAESMAGKVAVVSEVCRPEGAVRFDGAIWRARCEAGAGLGDEVRILRIDGLTLHVEPAGGG